MDKKEEISISVIKRLPRYYRFLQSLKENGIIRISSKELAARMGLTASQIRHDFNCFGGFGQQGYGYNVPELHTKICGNMIKGIPVRNIEYLENFCIDNKPVCAVICIPSNDMKELTDLLINLGIKSFWNFSNYDIAMAHPEVLVENAHLTDSLMTLGYLTSSLAATSPEEQK